MLPEWATWSVNPDLEPWTVGIEEEVMLLEPDGSPAWRSEDVLRALPDALAEHTRGETHGLALELATDPHRTVGDGGVRSCATCAPGSPTRSAGSACAPRSRARTRWSAPRTSQVSPGARYQYLHSVAARARAARADVRAARARRGAGPGARRARLQRHARAHPGAARAGGQLAVHARARQRARLAPARPSSRPSRAPASRASSPPTPTTPRRSTC